MEVLVKTVSSKKEVKKEKMLIMFDILIAGFITYCGSGFWGCNQNPSGITKKSSFESSKGLFLFKKIPGFPFCFSRTLPKSNNTITNLIHRSKVDILFGVINCMKCVSDISTVFY